MTIAYAGHFNAVQISKYFGKIKLFVDNWKRFKQLKTIKICKQSLVQNFSVSNCYYLFHCSYLLYNAEYYKEYLFHTISDVSLIQICVCIKIDCFLVSSYISLSPFFFQAKKNRTILNRPMRDGEVRTVRTLNMFVHPWIANLTLIKFQSCGFCVFVFRVLRLFIVNVRIKFIVNTN